MLNKVLTVGVENGASDIHFRPGAPPLFRLNGDLRPAEHERLTPRDTSMIATALLERVSDARRLDERVERLQTHFEQTSKDVREIRISTGLVANEEMSFGDVKNLYR